MHLAQNTRPCKGDVSIAFYNRLLHVILDDLCIENMEDVKLQLKPLKNKHSPQKPPNKEPSLGFFLEAAELMI